MKCQSLCTFKFLLSQFVKFFAVEMIVTFGSLKSVFFFCMIKLLQEHDSDYSTCCCTFTFIKSSLESFTVFVQVRLKLLFLLLYTSMFVPPPHFLCLASNLFLHCFEFDLQ